MTALMLEVIHQSTGLSPGLRISVIPNGTEAFQQKAPSASGTSDIKITIKNHPHEITTIIVE